MSAKAGIYAWQCYDFSNDTDHTDPTTGEFEGEYCDTDNGGPVIPCTNFDEIDLPIPAGGLPPGGNLTVLYDFNDRPDLWGNCFGGTYMGVDVLLREPQTNNDPAGIRSAKKGPLVGDPNNAVEFQGIYPRLKSGNTRSIRNFLINSQE